MSGYIGTQPVPQATQTRDSFTATSGQTSFATGGYTPNFLDVYLNGVKLAAADYTATNGSDVVLASGAATGDILEVVAFTTFNSASSSIDDNGTGTALTIDSSGNLLVGRTTLSGADNTPGAYIFNEGALVAQRSSNPSLYLNRYGTDGDIALFRKDGSTVASIGTYSGTLAISSANTGIMLDDTNNILRPTNASGGSRDGIISLGTSSQRFKDAYLSGGVYLGGTGSANKLDDYEEGDWTPTPNSGSFSTSGGKYTKIGRVVTLNFDITVGTGGGSQIILPFSAATTTANAIYTSNQNFATGRTAFYGVAAGVYMYFRVTGDNVSYTTQTLDGGATIHASITYHTT